MLMATWLVLMVSLPPTPSSFRVRVWRKLRTLGAVALRNSVYLLPSTPDNFERFQWLGQEVQKDGGEATLLSVEQIENIKRSDVVRLFQQAREPEYRALAERYRKVARALDRKTRHRSTARRDEELTRLARELERIHDIDFFDAPSYHEIKRVQETIEMRLHPPRPGSASEHDLPLDSLKGRRWVTRPRPHVDRLRARSLDTRGRIAPSRRWFGASGCAIVGWRSWPRSSTRWISETRSSLATKRAALTWLFGDSWRP